LNTDDFDVRENRGVWFIDRIFRVIATLDSESLLSHLAAAIDGKAPTSQRSGGSPDDMELAAKIAGVARRNREPGAKPKGLQVEVAKAADISVSKLKRLLNDPTYLHAKELWQAACGELHRGRPRQPRPTIETDQENRTIESIASEPDSRDQIRRRSVAR